MAKPDTKSLPEFHTIRNADFNNFLPESCGLTAAQIAKLGQTEYDAFILKYCASDVQKLNRIREELRKRYRANAQSRKMKGIAKKTPDRKEVQDFFKERFSRGKAPVNVVIHDFAKHWALKLEEICVMDFHKLSSLLNGASDEEKKAVLLFRKSSICRYHAESVRDRKKNELFALQSKRLELRDKINKAHKVIAELKCDITNVRQSNETKLRKLQAETDQGDCNGSIVAKLNRFKTYYELFNASCELKESLSCKKLEVISGDETRNEKTNRDIELLEDKLAFNEVQQKIYNQEPGVNKKTLGVSLTNRYSD